MTAYYNEIEPFAAQWLRNLIAAGHVAPGDVDERSILDVHPDDLRTYRQCHFFAGVGIWSYALRRAGWPDDRRVWTGSCPCQPFSAAGAGTGFADERHLWPAWFHLVTQRRPAVIFGEQVAGKDAEPWLDLVQTDLEGVDYTFGAVPFPAAGVGAPHVRDRLYFVAVANGQRSRVHAETVLARQPKFSGSCSVGELAYHDADGRASQALDRIHDEEHHAQPRSGARELADGGRAGLEVGRLESAREELETAERGGDAGGLGHAESRGRGRRSGELGGVRSEKRLQTGADGGAGATDGFWRAVDWLACRDGRWRPVEPGAFPLAHGAPGRVGRLRAYGNGLCAPQAQAWIQTVMECLP